MITQQQNGFNLVIEYIYKYIVDEFKSISGITLDGGRFSYHNDYDEITIFYSPKTGTNIITVITIDLDYVKSISNNEDLLSDIKYALSTEYTLINYIRNILTNKYNNGFTGN